MNKTTLIMAFYCNPGMLLRHYKTWIKLDKKIKEALEVIVVDDGSPEGQRPPLPPEDLGFPVKLFRMLVDIRWNQDACRNLGADHAAHDWLLLTDMDHLVTVPLLQKVLFGKGLHDNTAYRFSRVSAPDLSPYKLHPNSWFMSKKLYQEIGGYDERFAGYYGTDGDFRDRVSKKAAILQLREQLIRVPREVIPDASTQPSYGRKSPEDGHKIIEIKKARGKGDQAPMRQGFPFERVF